MIENSRVIDGKKLAKEIRQNLAQKIEQFSQKPVLAVVLVGHLEASRIYVRNKKKAAEEVGIDCRIIHLDEDITQNELQQQIVSLNTRSDVHGIIIQQPLPKSLEIEPLLRLISPDKDVDGFCPENLGLLMINSPRAFVAATPKGVLRMLQSLSLDLNGKNALVIGRSHIVGKPLAQLLLNQNCTVTIVHSKTQNIESLVQQADIVVAACGCPKLVKKEWLKKGAVVIDVGINRENGRLCGDVDFDDVLSQVSFISPVPGGVGPMTIAMLLENTYEAFLRQHKE